ncbi:MAG: PD-(D/E)XK nuclease family protein, partial [Pirellulales bacterium]
PNTGCATGSASAERTTGVHWQSQWHPANRPDLFAKASATLNELRRHHPQLELRLFAARPADWPALEHLTTYIFGHPGQVPSPSAEVLDSLNRIELVEAAGTHDEIVEIARRIKERLVSGQARPNDIVVAFRSLADVAPRVREVFDQFGIPYYLESDPPLVHTALLKVLLDLVRLDAEDWPFRQLISIVTNNTLTSLDAGARQAADWLVRDLQIAQGRRALLDRVDELAAAEPSAGLAEYARRRAAKAQEANPVFLLLADALDGLPQEATPAEWCQALSRAATALGLPPFARRTDNPVRQLDRCFQDGQDCPSYDPTDLTAWQSLVNHFAALERLDAWLGQPSRKWSRFELTRALVDAAAHETLPRPNDDVGRVRILPAPVARNVPARHLFLAGMSELSFPSSERAGRLATEADYNYFTRVADQDLASTSTDSATRSQEEMLLFYEVLSRAKESLTISYPALDEQGQSLPPSPYVVEIERMLGDEGIKSVRRCSPHLSPIPRDASAYSLVDWRTQAIAQALDGDCRLLAGMLACESTKPLSGAIDAGIRIVHARAHGESFGPAEGVLRSPAVAARLAQRFGPQHLWSPSQWETYAACPYKFFLEGVLGLEPLGDLVLETDLARRGSRLHHVLAAFHREWPDVRTARSLTPQDEAQQFLDHLHKVIDERIAVSPRGGIEAALLELDRRQLRKWAAAHFDHHAKYDGTCAKRAGSMTPAHFEFRFGPPRPGDENDPDSVHDAFVLDIDGEQIRITGQIDRVDVGTLKGHAVFNVIDYKSGRKTSLKSEHIESGEKLQLPIYVEAAQMLLFGGKARPLVAGYWSMTAGFDSKGALAVVPEDDHAERWQSIQATTHRLIQQFVHAIRNGEFPVASRDDKCTSYCDFNTVCRISQIRSLNKTWPPETKP